MQTVAPLARPSSFTGAAPRFSAEHALTAALLLWVLVLCAWPLARLFVEAFSAVPGQPFALFAEAWDSTRVWRAFRNTLAASAGATLVSMLLGTSVALLLGLTDVRARASAVFVFLLPLLIPPQILAMAWAELLGPGSAILAPLGLAPAPGTPNPLYSGTGVALVMGVEHSAVVFLAVRAAMRNLPRDLVEAARLAGASPLLVTRRILLPLLRPAMLAGAAVAFVSAIGNFGVPALLGIPGRFPMLTTLIYQRLNGFGPKVLGEVSVIGVLLVLLAAAGLGLRAWLVRRTGSIERGAPLQPFALGARRPWAEALLWLLLGFCCLLPLFALVAGSLVPAVGVPLNADTASLAHYRSVLGQSNVLRAFANSFMLAASAALACALVAVPFAYLATLRRVRAVRVLDAVADAPYAVPGIVLSIGVILVFLKPLPLLGVSLYGTLGIIFVAYLSRFLPLALRPAGAAFETLDRAVDEAAQMAGAGVLTRLRRVLLPLVAPSVAAGAILVFMTAFNELTVSALLWSTGAETLGVVVFMLHYEGNSPAASAVAVMSITVTLLLAIVMSLLARRLPPGTVPWQA
ncbi:ABC transporter permease [Uliginosibacterium sp. H1]|uniref:ABC transporter permease n=1 Tax=Uliginosibacterium sp. H1 TaxID=3114757 RepID=UPI002E179E66|nr:iron ABC transporter permease [Uliginosibacterium sp. H1]